MGAAIPMVMMAGSAISALGAISQANAAKSAASYNAQIQERNAMVATQQAAADAERVRRQGVQTEGSILAGYGASGVATDEGSPMDVLKMSIANAKLDEETVLYKGRLKATGYADEATLSRYSGKVAQQQGYLKAASYLIGGAGKAGATYAAAQRPLSRTAGVDSAYYED